MIDPYRLLRRAHSEPSRNEVDWWKKRFEDAAVQSNQRPYLDELIDLPIIPLADMHHDH